MIEQARSRENFLMSGRLSRRRVLQGVAGLAAVGVPRSKASAQEPAKSKTVYLSFLLHGNMCYDRYTKQEIREKFPRIYATGVRALKAYPEVTAHIDFPGLTLLSLKRYAPGFLEELKPLVDCRQVAMVGCQYAASHALASDEESDLVASRVSMELMRRELQPDCSAFFPQEIVFHPQMPYVMNQIGVRRLIVMPDGWDRPRRVQGIDGSAVDVFPLDLRTIRLGQLEAYYDAHADGSFIMAGGDFEQLGDIGAYVAEIARLAQKGKIIRWTTVERYAQEVGIHVTCAAPHPFGQAKEDREPSPSFSRWTSHPMDMSWHGHAVKALDALRAAGFAHAAAALHRLGPVDGPLALVAADGSPLSGALACRAGQWTASARVELPAYGYRLLGLREQPGAQPAAEWRAGSAVLADGKRAGLTEERLTVAEGARQIEIAVAPFRLSDPSGAAAAEEVRPDWSRATTRVRETPFGPELEVFTELAWAMWLRLVIGLRPDRVEVTACVQVDMPRRIGKGKYDPAGLLLEFRGWPGRVRYDIPNATIEHANPEPSFIAAQRFASIDGGDAAFAVVALGGNQSFRIAPRDGVIAASLGASIQGRADKRPECKILPSGYADHLITSGGDPFLGGYEHRFGLVLCPPAEVAAAADRLRVGVPLFRVRPGNGEWPAQQSLIALDAPSARVTAFRVNQGECRAVVNNLGETPCEVRCGGEALTLPAFGIRELTLRR
jgi:hypothetical protein